jgi:hypothetical protein
VTRSLAVATNDHVARRKEFGGYWIRPATECALAAVIALTLVSVPACIKFCWFRERQLA